MLSESRSGTVTIESKLVTAVREIDRGAFPPGEPRKKVARHSTRTQGDNHQTYCKHRGQAEGMCETESNQRQQENLIQQAGAEGDRES